MSLAINILICIMLDSNGGCNIMGQQKVDFIAINKYTFLETGMDKIYKQAKCKIVPTNGAIHNISYTSETCDSIRKRIKEVL